MPRLRQAYGTLALLLVAAAVSAACYLDDAIVTTDGNLSVGTWGGENAGLIVNDTIAHVHIACTLGNFPAPVAVDENGRFNVTGTYVLRAYPVFVGPYHPAQFAGQITGNRLTLTVTVSDTVEKKTVTVGPVTVTFKQEPRMGPCPICKKPGDMAQGSSLGLTGR
ncbi:MAG TPA: hypothetical protein VGQ52_08185 [Gemmatimonadaceae bacterium]|nr:hypothetical protein [Gemmatimonadaceae bacterium]